MVTLHLEGRGKGGRLPPKGTYLVEQGLVSRAQVVSLLVSQPHWLNETFSAGCSPCRKLVILPGSGSKNKICFVCASPIPPFLTLWVGDLRGCGHLPPLPCCVGPGGIPLSVVLSVGCQLRLKVLVGQGQSGDWQGWEKCCGFRGDLAADVRALFKAAGSMPLQECGLH